MKQSGKIEYAFYSALLTVIIPKISYLTDTMKWPVPVLHYNLMKRKLILPVMHYLRPKVNNVRPISFIYA